MNFILNSPTWFISLTALFGLLIGSFLNVVIARLPMRTHQAWRAECREFLGLETLDEKPSPSLVFDRSRCPKCEHSISALENIPILSFLMLKGRCSACKEPISLRYPIIELLTALVSAAVAWKFGASWQTLFGLILSYSLICLAMIDIDHQQLFDSITQPLIWLGLLLGLNNLYTDYASSLIGAIAGYLSLWTVYQLFKLITGKEGMGFGDFKLLALFGAWLGWQLLPLIVLLSSMVGAIVGLSMIAFFNHEKNKPIPFGPYLALAGWIALLSGHEINSLYLNYIGQH